MCSCSRKVVGMENEHTHYDSTLVVIKERVDSIISSPDSAYIKALLECGENGEILISQLEQKSTENANLLFCIDSLGNLLANFNTEPKKIYIHSTDTIVKEKGAEVRIEKTTETVMVEKKLSAFQRFILKTGVGTWIVIVMTIIAYLIYSRKKKD